MKGNGEFSEVYKLHKNINMTLQASEEIWTNDLHNSVQFLSTS